MHLPLTVKVDQDTWDELKKRLNTAVSIYIGELQILYDKPSDVAAELTFEISNNTLECLFDDGKQFISEEVREDFNKTLLEHTYRASDKLKDLVKNKQEKL